MARKENPPLSVNEAYELAPGDKDNPVWVDGLRGEVVSITPKRLGAASTFSVVLMNEGGGRRLSVTYWDEPRFGVGDTIEVSGTGARRTEYKGDHSVSLSRNNITRVVTAGARSAAAPGQARAASRAPANDERGGGHHPDFEESFENAATAGQQRPASAPQHAPAPSASDDMPVNPFSKNGPRTGMCVELAVSIILHNAAHRPAKPVAGKDGISDGASHLVDLALLQHDVEAIAAALMAACHRMETGMVKINLQPSQPVEY